MFILVRNITNFFLFLFSFFLFFFWHNNTSDVKCVEQADYEDPLDPVRNPQEVLHPAPDGDGVLLQQELPQ